ncbi:MAG: hypothetical protein HUK14_09360 [Muribaculaceae bacterium]|nr:hypothetical protein [Muribaculaceae bacterium]
MKTIKKMAIMALALTAAATTLSSCSKDKDEELNEAYIKKNIVGKWKIVSNNYGEVLTNNRRVNSYAANGKMFISQARKRDGVFYWDDNKEADYSVSGTTLTQSFNYTSTDPDKFTVTKLSKGEMGLKYVTPRDEGKLTNMTMKLVTADYTKQLQGLWEGVAMTGVDQYDAANYRIDFKANGKYDYYRKEDSKWVIQNENCDYILDGDWLATRWQDGSQTGFSCESWDIVSCSDTELKLTALREKADGNRYTATFTAKRVK